MLINTVVMEPTTSIPQQDLIKQLTTAMGANIGLVVAGIMAGEIGGAVTLKIMREIVINAESINFLCWPKSTLRLCKSS